MIRINLLPLRQIKAEFGRRQELVVAGLFLAATAVLIIFGYLFQAYRLSRLENEQASLRQEIQSLNAQVKGVTEMEGNVAELRGKLKVIGDLNTKRTGPVRVMETLSSVTPARLWLTQFKEAGGTLALEGLAVDNQTIAEFLKSLQGSPYFENVELVETAQIDQGGVPLKRFAVRSRVLYQQAQPSPPPRTDASPATKGGKQG